MEIANLFYKLIKVIFKLERIEGISKEEVVRFYNAIKSNALRLRNMSEK